jgi:hypothetical protein
MQRDRTARAASAPSPPAVISPDATGPDPTPADALAWLAAESEELSAELRLTLDLADEEADPPDWPAVELDGVVAIPPIEPAPRTDPASVEPAPEAAPTSAEPVRAPTIAPACPPHHWLIGESADPDLLAWTCLRCGSMREHPRDPEPAWRARQAQRGRGSVPTPSFGQP